MVVSGSAWVDSGIGFTPIVFHTCVCRYDVMILFLCIRNGPVAGSHPAVGRFCEISCRLLSFSNKNIKWLIFHNSTIELVILHFLFEGFLLHIPK